MTSEAAREADHVRASPLMLSMKVASSGVWRSSRRSTTSTASSPGPCSVRSKATLSELELGLARGMALMLFAEQGPLTVPALQSGVGR